MTRFFNTAPEVEEIDKHLKILEKTVNHLNRTINPFYKTVNNMYNPPEAVQHAKRQIERLTPAIKATKERIEVLSKIKNSEPVTDNELAHLILQTELEKYADYENVVSASVLENK